jgi:hypothetical protein
VRDDRIVTNDDLGPWDPYDVSRVQQLFAPADVRWWLSGGVALDLFLGYASRSHGDIDVSVLRADWPVLEPHLTAWLDVHIAQGGQLTSVDERQVTSDVHNLWAREDADGAWRVQVNLEEGDGSRWVYRRDPRISRTWEDVIRHDGAVPYVNPAVQLLWKAKRVGAKDQADFDAVVPRLAADERGWLSWAIDLAHPTSPWNGAT